jgi:hypothetical protein
MRVCTIVIAALLLFSTPPARAECTNGDLHAILNSITVFARLQRPKGIDSHMLDEIGGPVGGPCQYRLFYGPPNYPIAPQVATFTAGQFFLGGIKFGWDYVNEGFSREAAIEDIQLVEQHVYIIPADSQWNYDASTVADYEQPLVTSAMRNFQDYRLGLSVVQQTAIITQLPVGRYVSLYTVKYPGNPTLLALHPDDPDWVDTFSPQETSAVVNLDIVPAP